MFNTWLLLVTINQAQRESCAYLSEIGCFNMPLALLNTPPQELVAVVHVSPVCVGGHRHINKSPNKEVQVPPFWQGWLSQADRDRLRKHNGGSKPSLHWQVAIVPFATQVPPFRHVLKKHGSIVLARQPFCPKPDPIYPCGHTQLAIPKTPITQRANEWQKPGTEQAPVVTWSPGLGMTSGVCTRLHVRPSPSYPAGQMPQWLDPWNNNNYAG